MEFHNVDLKINKIKSTSIFKSDFKNVGEEKHIIFTIVMHHFLNITTYEAAKRPRHFDVCISILYTQKPMVIGYIAYAYDEATFKSSPSCCHNLEKRLQSFPVCI